MNLLCVCVQVFSCLCRFVCLVSKDVSFCESLSVTEVHWMSPKCLCVLIAGDRYHQSWHHWQMNGSAVFSSCPVSLSDSHSMQQQQQQQQKLLFFQLNFYHKVLHHIEVWLNVTGYQAERIFFLLPCLHFSSIEEICLWGYTLQYDFALTFACAAIKNTFQLDTP